MFDQERFIQKCIGAVAEGQPAVREVVAEAVADSAGVIAAFGEPEHAGIIPLYRSPELSIGHKIAQQACKIALLTSV